MVLQLTLAATGVLRNWAATPPPIAPVLLVTLVLTIVLARRSPGVNAGFATLIGVQAFRLPLELLMHKAAADGLMPRQMTFPAGNFDIATGITALPVAWLAARDQAPRWLLVAWNAMGSALLAIIIGMAVASTPVFHAFGPEHLNTWIADAPYIWLPGVLVPTALFGHIVIFRKLRRRRVGYPTG